MPTATFHTFFYGLLFRSTLWMCVQNLKSVALPVPRDRFLKKELWERRVRAPKERGSRRGGVWGCAPSPEKKFQFWILNGRILLQTGCFLYSLPKAGLNAVPTVKITLGTPFRFGNAVPRRSHWKRPLPVPVIIGGNQEILGSLSRSLFSQVFNGLLFRGTLWKYLPNLKTVAEII